MHVVLCVPILRERDVPTYALQHVHRSCCRVGRTWLKMSEKARAEVRTFESVCRPGCFELGVFGVGFLLKPHRDSELSFALFSGVCQDFPKEA